MDNETLMNTETMQEILTMPEVWIGVSAFVILFILILVMRSSNLKKAKKHLQELEVRYNSLKSVPLSFKLNKSVAIARLNEETMNSVTHCKDDFDLCQSNLKQIAAMLADVEDSVSMKKMKGVKDDLTDLDNLCDLAESQIKKLEEFLDKILEKESAQRAEVTRMKEEFRRVKQLLNDKNGQLSYCWDMIEFKVTECEKQFTLFEEWMYASEFEKAGAVLEIIHDKVDELSMIANEFPLLLQEARGFIPNLVDEVIHRYTAETNRGVYLQHLEIRRNTDLITSSLQEDLGLIRAGQIENTQSHLEDYKIRLNQLLQQIDRESMSFDEVAKNQDRAVSLIEDSKQLQEYVLSMHDVAKERFGLADMTEMIQEKDKKVDEISRLCARVLQMVKSSNVPSSTVLISLKELVQNAEIVNGEYRALKDKLDTARADEERAKKQLLKLQLIMNEMEVKIKKNKLPSISGKYQDDLQKAYHYVTNVEHQLDMTPLDISNLNATLAEAIDYIYKLYNNVNNIVGMAIMVENTIVFGNKYRSTYPDIDSELTRAELCFRNGEYTQALTIAISTIEKIFPDTYEKLIKENAKSAA
ncbi:MAG: hypothetical protein IJ356_05765 [Erysipelotrichaceae bacterium]|nr:hypothetical protein [Erysipelotrichaceae bacterium]